MKKKVFFLIRGYNDLDCRLSLINNFANQSQYKVSMIGIPTNNGINDYKNHEILRYLVNSNVHYQTIFDLNKTLSIKTLFWFYNIFKPCDGILGKICNRIILKLFKVIVYISYKSSYWFDDLIKSFYNAIIIIDEIAFQKNRSFFVDELINQKDHFSIYSFTTGQDTYLNLWYDKDKSVLFKTPVKINIPLFVPSDNDNRINKRSHPAEQIITIGNTRFDSAWIKKLSTVSKIKIKSDKLLKKHYKYKITFMLSKIEYGVDLDNIIELINECTHINDTLVILKPHTRGMTINNWKNNLHPNIVDGNSYSSSELIEWADTVLFTGSSIIYQAMILHKKVIFLKYCQKYKTIFDNLSAVCVAQNLDNALHYIKNVPKDQVDTKGLNEFVNMNSQNSIIDGLVCESVVNLIEKMEINNTV